MRSALINAYMTAVNDNHAIYVDGMGDGPRSLAMDRYREGKREAKSLIKKIHSGKIKLDVGETIKVVGHSHGAAFAAGMADYLVKRGYTLENYDAFAPHQPNQFRLKDAIKIANKRQYSRYSDEVSTTGSLPLLFGMSQLARIGGIHLGGFHMCKDVDGDMGGHYIETFLPDVFKVDSEDPTKAITLTLPGINVRPAR